VYTPESMFRVEKAGNVFFEEKWPSSTKISVSFPCRVLIYAYNAAEDGLSDIDKLKNVS
jgi:hypothetical protein